MTATSADESPSLLVDTLISGFETLLVTLRQTSVNERALRERLDFAANEVSSALVNPYRTCLRMRNILLALDQELQNPVAMSDKLHVLSEKDISALSIRTAEAMKCILTAT
jgi:hypothetical protein